MLVLGLLSSSYGFLQRTTINRRLKVVSDGLNYLNDFVLCVRRIIKHPSVIRAAAAGAEGELYDLPRFKT